MEKNVDDQVIIPGKLEKSEVKRRRRRSGTRQRGEKYLVSGQTGESAGSRRKREVLAQQRRLLLSDFVIWPRSKVVAS